MRFRDKLSSLILVLSLTVGSLPLWAAAGFSNSQAREVLAEILNSREFSQTRQMSRLEELVEALLRWFGYKAPAAQIGDWSILVTGVFVVVGLVLGLYLLRLVAPFWQTLAPEVREGEEGGAGSLPPTPANLLAQAEAKARAGDFRDALRHLYLSLLMDLDGRKVITYRAAKTNFEYLREITNQGVALQETFRDMVNLFEHKWYGLEECSPDDYRQGLDLYNALLRGVSNG